MREYVMQVATAVAFIEARDVEFNEKMKERNAIEEQRKKKLLYSGECGVIKQK